MEEGPPQPEVQPSRRRREPRRSARRAALLWTLRLAAVAVAFVAGLVVGRAVEDAPRPGGAQTGLRTLEPSTLAPVEQVTVTVTAP